MKRWNGWGDDDNNLDFELSASSREFIENRIGQSKPLKDATLEGVLATVPPSRLPEHRLISTQAEDRLRHSRGQSIPDWLAMRSGDFGVFPDGVAFPETILSTIE